MKLFDKLSKLKKTEDFNFGMSDIATGSTNIDNESLKSESNAIIDLDSKLPFSNTKDEIDGTDIDERQQPYVPPQYGIQETINLIHSLPEATPDVIIPVVIKTLESANINVNDIITDAAHREEAIESRSVDLVNSIEALEAKIAELNDEVLALNGELEDIAGVKNLLLNSLLEDEEAEEAPKSPLKMAVKPSAQTASSKKADTKKKTQHDELEDADFNELDEIDIDAALNEVNNIHIAQ